MVIYDPALTRGLPFALTITSAMNALAHAVEALYAPDRNPVVEMLCRAALAGFTAPCP